MMKYGQQGSVGSRHPGNWHETLIWINSGVDHARNGPCDVTHPDDCMVRFRYDPTDDMTQTGLCHGSDHFFACYMPKHDC